MPPTAAWPTPLLLSRRSSACRYGTGGCGDFFILALVGRVGERSEPGVGVELDRSTPTPTAFASLGGRPSPEGEGKKKARRSSLQRARPTPRNSRRRSARRPDR